MAENKKSFIAYSDWKDTFDALENETAGLLIKHIFSYVNDENPTTNDPIIKAVFPNIRNTLKRDLKKWGKQYQQRVDAGKKSAEIRKRNATTVNERSVSSTVSVSVNGSVINKSYKDKLKSFQTELTTFKNGYEVNMITEFYEYWTETDKNKKMRFEKEKTWDTNLRLKRWQRNNTTK